MQVEGGQREVGRVIMEAEPWDNWAFGPISLTSFLQVPAAVTAAGCLSPRPGGSDFEFHAASVNFPGAICCVRLKPSVFHDGAVCRFYDALASEGVRVANGTWFGDEARVFRLGFGLLSMPDLHVALNVLAEVLKQTARTDA